MVNLTFEEFNEQYGVINEPETIKDKPGDLNHTWTVVTGDYDSLWVCSGFRLVNRLGYIITEKPWESEIDVDWNDYISKEETLRILKDFPNTESFLLQDKESFMITEIKCKLVDFFEEKGISYNEDKIHNYFSQI